MFWRKDTPDETEEIRRFVDGMKRGQTLATSDSLLETLRQIHDRRETPPPVHEHRRMLLERLRREMRTRSGEVVVDNVRVPQFGTPPARRRFLEWAIAASLVVHAGVGAVALVRLHFAGSASPDSQSSTADTEERVAQWVAPRSNSRIDPVQTPSFEKASTKSKGRGEAEAVNVTLPKTWSPIPTTSSAPIGPPVIPGGGGPIVAGYSSASLDTQANQNLPEGPGGILAGPDEPRTFTEVSNASAERPDPADAISKRFDVAPRALNRPKPVYSEKALRLQIQGKVTVRALIGADGSVRDVAVVRSLGYGLDEAAVDAVRRTRFSPATLGGMPVMVRVNMEVSFEIH